MSQFNLTYRAYLADFLVSPFLIALALLIAFMHAAPAWSTLIAAVGGYLAWTGSEYVTHRFVFHNLYRREHWLHHIRPRANVGISPLYTIVAQVMLYGCLIGSMGLAIGTGLFAGYTAGYLAYLTAHHWIHRWTIPRGHWMRPAYDRHVVHHKGKEVNFNVLWPLWDKLCGTYEQPKGV